MVNTRCNFIESLFCITAMKTKKISPLQGKTALPQESSRGFTLVITISLLVLLTLIAIGLLSLSSVTIRGSAQQAKLSEARANARMALMLAIGELQKQMGPDQRISTTADQMMAPGGDGSTSSAAAGNRHWTGVYDSWAANVVNRPAPRFRSWLVSGDANFLNSAASANTALSAANSLELVGAGTLGTTAGERQVRVPAVRVNAGVNATGRLAWWVGDQGVKAAVGAPAPLNDTSLAFARNSLLSPARHAVELASVGSVKPFANLTPADTRLPLVTSWPQAGFVASDVQTPRALFHDLTASHSGLLTNVRAGGFRKDLSMKLESYNAPPDLSDPSNVLYYVQGEEGINFQELWSYYQLYNQLQYSGGSYTTGGSIPSTAPVLRTADSLDGLQNDFWDRYKHPITINYQNVLSFEMRPAPRDPGRQALFVTMDPIVTLWNPLDVAVDVRPHTNQQGARKCMMYVYWVIPYDINVQVSGSGLRRCSIMRSVYNKDFANSTGGIDYNMIRLNVGEVEQLTLKPGEVLKISQTGATQGNNGGFVGLNGSKGFNYGGGARFPLLDENGQYILLDGGEQISYSVSPNNLTAGRDNGSGGNIIAGFGQNNSRRWSMSHNSVVIGSPWGDNVHIGMVGIDHCYGYRRAKVGETRSASSKTLSNSTRVFANDPQYAEVFPVIAGPQQTRVIPAASINSRKAPFMLHSYSIKTEMENKRGNRMMARFNPKAHNVDFFNLSEQERDMLPYQAGVIGLTSWLNAPLDESTTGQGFFGSSLGAEFGSNFVITHSVPRQPIISLAAFQNSFANGFNRLNESFRTEHAMARMPLLPQISHAIGNSLAPAVIPPNQTEGNLPSSPHPLADHSFLANRALWDDWFLSGISPQNRPAFAASRNLRSVATDIFNGTRPMINARYRAKIEGANPTQLITSFFSGNFPNNNAINNVASYLVVDGMFNVNSTSVEAWKSVLGALKDRPIVVRNENGVESIAPRDANTPVIGVNGPRDVVIRDDAAMRREQWNGRRTLNDQEIEELARAIVIEIRKRGPFLSLADFVNRRVGNDRELAKSGAIQSALDSRTVSINRNQNESRAVAPTSANRMAFPDAERGPMAYGAPSLVKQGDILTPIAPHLSARSDTFIIRSYGEATDANGNIVARAWCEAELRRDRNFIVNADRAETQINSLTRPLNRAFGRRFLLTSFRWLQSNEI